MGKSLRESFFEESQELAEELSAELKKFLVKKVPNRKLYLLPLPNDGREQLRSLLRTGIRNNWFSLGEAGLKFVYGGKLYGPDKHSDTGNPGDYRSYCVLHNDLKEAALTCWNLEQLFPGRVQCFVIPYIEGEHFVMARPLFWYRVKVLFRKD